MKNIATDLLDNDAMMESILKEIDANDVDVSSIKLNKELNPLFWDKDGLLKPEIRKTLLLNAKRFMEFADLDNYHFIDVVLTGSIANYNYTNLSDVDIHIIFDFKQISGNLEFIQSYFKLKKEMWSQKLPIKIKGHDVELYVQDETEHHTSTGLFSLIKNDWITKPTKKIINIDTNNLKLKTSNIVNSIEGLESEINDKDFINKYNELKNKIKKYRKIGLDKNGEYATENLVFKLLRNNGFLKKLVELKDIYLTKELSLK